MFAFMLYAGSETKTVAQDVDELHKTYDLLPGAKLTLNNVAGKVKIETWNESYVKIDAKKHGKNIHFPAVRININHHRNKKHLHIDTLYPRGFSSDVTVNYDIKVPSFVLLNGIKTVEGEIEIEGPTAGPVVAVTSSGNIDIKHVNGNVSATTKSGNVRVKNVNGYILATSITGDVHIKDSEGKIRTKSVSGKVSHDNTKSI